MRLPLSILILFVVMHGTQASVMDKTFEKNHGKFSGEFKEAPEPEPPTPAPLVCYQCTSDIKGNLKLERGIPRLAFHENCKSASAKLPEHLLVHCDDLKQVITMFDEISAEERKYHIGNLTISPYKMECGKVEDSITGNVRRGCSILPDTFGGWFTKEDVIYRPVKHNYCSYQMCNQSAVPMSSLALILAGVLLHIFVGI